MLRPRSIPWSARGASRSTNHASAMLCIQVPLTEIVWPTNHKR